MPLYTFGVNLSDMLIPLVLFSFFGLAYFFIFYCFKRSNDKSIVNFINSHQLSSLKKKNKKKYVKSSKSSENKLFERKSETRHIEIMNSPEILEESDFKTSAISPFMAPGRPILRNSDEEIFIGEEESTKTMWKKIPKDEVEILRSRHSSVVSEVRVQLIDDNGGVTSKVSRNQKKRLKEKLKNIGNDIQCNNSATRDSMNDGSKEAVDTSNDQDTTKSKKSTKKSAHKHSKTTSSNSVPSQVGEKIQSVPLAEDDIKKMADDIKEDIKPDIIESVIDNNYDNIKFTENFAVSEEKHKLEQEIKELKDERFNAQQKLNEIPSLMATIMALKKDSETYLKKYEDLGQTCNTMKKELSSAIQKNSSNENQFSRYKSEMNQRIAFYENEKIKLTSKSSVLENDNRAKVVELETSKNHLERMNHLVSEKDKLIQNQNIEIASNKEQMFNIRIAYQDLESKMKISQVGLQEYEDQIRFANAEIQRLMAQLDKLSNEKNRIQNDFESFKRKSKAQEHQQDTVISSLQYQLDEYRKERQQCLMFGQEGDNSKMSNNRSKADSNVPVGYQLIESDVIKKFTLLIQDGNQKLQEKCEHYNTVIDGLQSREVNLLDQNSVLKDEYSKLHSEFDNRLKEIVVLRKSIETLQSELSKNSEANLGELKIELDNNDRSLSRTETVLVKSELSYVEDVNKLSNSVNGDRQDSVWTENDVSNQISATEN